MRQTHFGAGGLLLLAALGLVSCASERSATTLAAAPPVWPEPPAPARLAYVQSVYSPADLGLKSSAWSRATSWLTGLDKGGERMTRPFGIALDESGNLCWTDTGAACVCFVDFLHKSFRRWNKIGDVALQSPVAVAKRNDTIWVADSQLGKVLGFNTSGKLLFVLTNNLARPTGLAAGPDRLYVADAQLHHVAVFDMQGRFLFDFGRRGAGPGEFNFPTHLTVGPGGQLLVTDSLNGRVEAFDAAGHFQAVIGGPGDTSGHFGRPKGVAADQYGHVYVMDALFDNVQIFDLDGHLLLGVGAAGAGPGEFWLPGGIAIGGDNRIFIADSYNRRIEVFKYVGGP